MLAVAAGGASLLTATSIKAACSAGTTFSGGLVALSFATRAAQSVLACAVTPANRLEP